MSIVHGNRKGVKGVRYDAWYELYEGLCARVLQLACLRADVRTALIRRVEEGGTAEEVMPRS